MKKYKSGRQNHYNFPDTKEYKGAIIDLLKFRVKMKYHLIDPNENDTNIDIMEKS